jgi:hypothetical protein
MIRAKFRLPFRAGCEQGSAKGIADFKFDLVALAIVETDGFHLREAIKRPGKAGCGILPAAEKDQGFFLRHAV